MDRRWFIIHECQIMNVMDDSWLIMGDMHHWDRCCINDFWINCYKFQLHIWSCTWYFYTWTNLYRGHPLDNCTVMASHEQSTPYLLSLPNLSPWPEPYIICWFLLTRPHSILVPCTDPRCIFIVFLSYLSVVFF